MLIDIDDIIFEIDFKLNNLKELESKIISSNNKVYLEACVMTLTELKNWLLGKDDLPKPETPTIQ